MQSSRKQPELRVLRTIGGPAYSVIFQDEDDDLWKFLGYDTYGRSARQPTFDSSSPVAIVSDWPLPFIQAGGGDQFTFGVDWEGHVWSWGRNDYGGCGDGTITNRTSPVSLLGNHSFTYVAGGLATTTANGGGCIGLKTGVSVWGWGNNDGGLCGDGSTTHRSSPVSVQGSALFNPTSVAIGFGSAALLNGSTGNVWSWGSNGYGQLGDGSATNRQSPVSMLGAHSFTKIDVGGQNFAGVKSDGSIWVSGGNAYGQLGDSSITLRSSPVSVVGDHSFTSVAAGPIAVLGLKSDGSLWCWGRNDYGYCGDGSVTHRSSPVSVIGEHSFTEIYSSGVYSSFAKKSDGSIWSWGANDFGQLGDGSITHRSSPVSVLSSGSVDYSFSTVSKIFRHTVLLGYDKRIYTMGNNSYFQLCPIVSRFPFPANMNMINLSGSFKSISTGSNQTSFLKSDGTAWCVGHNGETGGNAGGLGDGTAINKWSPVSVIGDHSFIKIVSFYNNTAALKDNGSVWSWGQGATYGINGDGTVADRSSPVSVVGNHSFVDIIPGGVHCFGLKHDGEVWGWGYNPPALGDANQANRSSPVSVSGGHFFKKVGAGTYNGFGLKMNGSVWSWGYNYRGSLGDGSATSRNSPVSVLGGHEFVDIANYSNENMCALKANGSAWCWGSNIWGQIGDGTSGAGGYDTSKSTPTAVIGNHSFIKVYGSQDGFYGVKSDGSVWAWGANNYGQLGDGTFEHRSSPVLSVVKAFVRFD